MSLGLALALFPALFGALSLFAQTDESSDRPTNLTVELHKDWVLLRWNAPVLDAESVTGYRVLRRESGKDALGEFKVIKGDTGSIETFWMDATADEPGVQYVYRVNARRGDDLSKWSSWSMIVLPTAIPTATPEPKATPAAVPTATSTPAATPEPTPTPVPEPAATSTPTPTATHTPEPTATPTAVPTATIEPTATPEASVTSELTITGYALVAGGSGNKLRDLVDGTRVVLSEHDTSSFAIRLDTSDDDAVREVKLSLSGSKSRNQTEKKKPWSLYGDNGEDDLRGNPLPAGEYSLTAEVYSKEGQIDTVLDTLSIEFTVVDEPQYALQHSDETDLGDITLHGSAGSLSGTVDGDLHYDFMLTDVREFSLNLTQHEAMADIYLETSGGEELASDQAGQLNQQVSRVLRAGSYRVHVRLPTDSAAHPFSFDYAVNGNISESEDLRFTADANTLGRIQVNATITGKYDADNDGADWVGVELEKGVRYSFLVRPQEPENIWMQIDATIDLWSYIVHEDGTEYYLMEKNEHWYQYSWEEYPLLQTDGDFTPPKSGLYFVKVGNWAGAKYKFTVVEVNDDFGASITSHGRVEVGGSVEGRIDWVINMGDYTDAYELDCDVPIGWDVDWFAVDLVAGKTYQIDMESIEKEGSLIGPLPDPYLASMYTPGGSLIGEGDNDSGAGRNARLYFRPPTSGAYFILATADYGGANGDYRLSVRDITPTEPDLPEDTSTPARITVGGKSVKSFSEHTREHDWFAVTLEAGKSYRVTAKGHEPFDLIGISGIRYGDESAVQAGTDIARQPFFPNPSQIVFTPTVSGDYYLDAGNRSCCSSYVWGGPYEVSVTDVEHINTQNFGDKTAEVHTATLGEKITTWANDPPNDGGSWFKIHLEQDQDYDIIVDKGDPPYPIGYEPEPFVRGVYDDGGVIIPNSNRSRFTPPATGLFYVRAGRNLFSWGMYGGASSSIYNFTVKEAEPPPPPPPTPEESLFAERDEDQVATLTPGVMADGAIDNPSSEHDWYKVELRGGDGKTYWLTLLALGDYKYTLGVPYLRAIYDSTGKVLHMDRGGDLPLGGFEIRPSEEDTYYVVAKGREDVRTGTNGIGTYGILVVDTTPPTGGDLAHDPSTTGMAIVGGSVIGELEENRDVDWFRVSLNGGATYQIDMLGVWGGEWIQNDEGDLMFVTPGTLHNPKLLGVYGGDSALIPGSGTEVNGEELNSRIESFTPAEDGDYYIAASHEGDAGTGTYQLVITDLRE